MNHQFAHLFAMSNNTVRIDELTRTETAFINLLPNRTVRHVLPISVLPISIRHVIMFANMGIVFATNRTL